MEQDGVQQNAVSSFLAEEAQAPSSLLNGVMGRLEQRTPFLNNPTVTPELLNGLEAPQWEIRAASVHSLGLLGEHQKALVHALHDEHRLVRASAVRALGRSGASEHLLLAWNDEAWEVREMIIQVLGEQLTLSVTSLLQTALHDTNSQVRETARYTLLQRRGISEQDILEFSQTAHISSVKQALWRPFVLLKSQIPLLQKSTWLLGLIGLAILFVACLLVHTSNHEWLLIAMTVAASSIGTAWTYGSEHDQGLELALATPTSIRLLLLCRLSLVLSYNILLAGLASGLMALVYGESFWYLVHLWLAPLCFLSSLSLLLSLLVSSLFASFVTLLFEATQTMKFSVVHNLPVLQFNNFHHTLWQQYPVTLLLIPLCVFLALVYAPNTTHLRQAK